MVRVWAILIGLFGVTSSWAFTVNDPSFKLGWAVRPIKLYVNTTNCSISEDALYQALDAAIDLWSGTPFSSLKLERGGTTDITAAQISAVFLHGTGSVPSSIPKGILVGCSTDFTTLTSGQQNGVVGAGQSYSTGGDGRVNLGFLLLNSESGALANVARVDSTILSIVIAHEIGHALGIGHSGDEGALMYYSVTGKTKLILSQDDIDAADFMYPAEEARGHGFMGCVSDADAGQGSHRERGFPLEAVIWWGLMGAIWLATKRASLRFF